MPITFRVGDRVRHAGRKSTGLVTGISATDNYVYVRWGNGKEICVHTHGLQMYLSEAQFQRNRELVRAERQGYDLAADSDQPKREAHLAGMLQRHGMAGVLNDLAGGLKRRVRYAFNDTHYQRQFDALVEFYKKLEQDDLL